MQAPEKNLSSRVWIYRGDDDHPYSVFDFTISRSRDGPAKFLAGYPSYCAKYNPIERRFFPHVARACQGMLFDTMDTVVRRMRRAATTTGLHTTVHVIRRVYEIGRKVADDFKDRMGIAFDDLLPKWNYVAQPQ